MIQNKKTKCFIIHGFGGGVYEVEPLAQYLRNLNYEVLCQILKGHCSTGKDMRRTKYTDWLQCVEKDLLEWIDEGDDVILIGFSMGGLIAFNLACKHQTKRIVTINTPIFYWNIPQVCKNLLNDLKHRSYNHIRRYIQAKKSSPLLSMFQFLFLLHHTKEKLKFVNCPILILQAEDDDTVRRKSTNYIYNHVTSNTKKIKCFGEGGHLILLSKSADQVMKSVRNFLEEDELR